MVSIQPKPEKGLRVGQNVTSFKLFGRFNPAEAREGFKSLKKN